MQKKQKKQRSEEKTLILCFLCIFFSLFFLCVLPFFRLLFLRVFWYTDLMQTHKQTLFLHAFRFAMYTLIGVVAVMAVIAFLRTDANSLEGRLLNAQERGEIPRASFNDDHARSGFSAPASTHVIFTIPDDTEILAATFLGGEDTWRTVRYWYYCFSGNEQANKLAGKRGNQLYDGKKGYSKAERDAQIIRAPGNTDLLGIYESRDLTQDRPLASEISIFRGGETCYLMTEATIPAGIDRDGDRLNVALERSIGTDPLRDDTDGDGIKDGDEVFITKTSPTSVDTDRDGLPDPLEDKNRDGLQNADETSALHADTDRDGLCDGDGTAPGCPEKRTNPFRGEDVNQNGIVDEGETDPRKKDTNGDGITDYDQRWNELQARSLGNRQ